MYKQKEILDWLDDFALNSHISNTGLHWPAYTWRSRRLPWRLLFRTWLCGRRGRGTCTLDPDRSFLQFTNPPPPCGTPVPTLSFWETPRTLTESRNTVGSLERILCTESHDASDTPNLFLSYSYIRKSQLNWAAAGSNMTRKNYAHMEPLEAEWGSRTSRSPHYTFYSLSACQIDV